MPALCFQAGEAMKPEEMRETVYVGLDTELPPFMPYPRFLLKMDISQTAKLLYALLLDRTTLSQKNQWEDDEGRIYIVYPIAEIAEMLDKSSMTVHNALNELDRAGLLERERRGFSAPSRLYVKVPPPIKFSLDMTQRKLYITPKENFTDDVKETLDMASRKLYPNKTNINKLTESQTKGASGEQPPAAFGRYKNVFLSDTELAELKAEYPDKWEYYVDRLSCHIASSGKNYQSHAATIYKWAQEDAAKQKPKKGIPDYSFKEGESL